MSNVTDRCAGAGNSISGPPVEPAGIPNVAIGPISNFSAAIEACCPGNGTTDTYPGGSPTLVGCYWYCAFNGTLSDFEYVQGCVTGAAQERRRSGSASGYMVLGRHPDLGKSSAAGFTVYEAPKMGAWKCAVLGLAFVGAVVGTL